MLIPTERKVIAAVKSTDTMNALCIAVNHNASCITTVIFLFRALVRQPSAGENVISLRALTLQMSCYELIHIAIPKINVLQVRVILMNAE